MTSQQELSKTYQKQTGLPTIEIVERPRGDGNIIVARDRQHIRFQLTRNFCGLMPPTPKRSIVIPIPGNNDPEIITRNNRDNPIHIGPSFTRVWYGDDAVETGNVEFGLWKQLDNTPVAQVLLTGIAGAATTWWEKDFAKSLSWVSAEPPSQVRGYQLRLEPDRASVFRGNELVTAAMIGETKDLDFGYPVSPGLALVAMTVLRPEAVCLKTHMG